MKEVHTLYKLIFLYLLDRVELPLTNGQICAFVAEEQYTDYFTVQETLADMVESKLLETELVRNSTFYSLTDSGKETLSYFKYDISTAIRKDIENYLKKNKMKLRDENAVLADYSNLDEGRFSVKLQIKEKDNYTYVKNTKGTYFKLYRVDNVVINAVADKKYKKEVNKVLKDLGY